MKKPNKNCKIPPIPISIHKKCRCALFYTDLEQVGRAYMVDKDANYRQNIQTRSRLYSSDFHSVTGNLRNGIKIAQRNQ